MSRDCIKSINSPPSLLLPRSGAHEVRTRNGRKVPPRLSLRRPSGVFCLRMRRWLVALVVLIAGASAGAVVYTAYATDREYSRLIAAGDSAAGNDQPFQALEAYSGAITLRPDSMVAHLKRGMTYRQRGELEAALKDLRRASALDPTSTVALDWLGDTYLTLGRFDRAAERYAAFVALDDRSPHAWYKLGLAHYRAGDAGPGARAAAAGHRARPIPCRSPSPPRALRCETRARRGPRARPSRRRRRSPPALTAPREALAGALRRHRRVVARDRPARGARGPGSLASGPFRRPWPRPRPRAATRSRGADVEPRRRTFPQRAARLRDARPRLAGVLRWDRRRGRAQEGARGADDRRGSHRRRERHVDRPWTRPLDVGRCRWRRTRVQAGGAAAAGSTRGVSRACRSRRPPKPVPGRSRSAHPLRHADRRRSAGGRRRHRRSPATRCGSAIATSRSSGSIGRSTSPGQHRPWPRCAAAPKPWSSSTIPHWSVSAALRGAGRADRVGRRPGN